jgi:hypothetical protein
MAILCIFIDRVSKVSKMLVTSLVSTQTAIGGWINKALVNSEVNKEKAVFHCTCGLCVAGAGTTESTA